MKKLSIIGKVGIIMVTALALSAATAFAKTVSLPDGSKLDLEKSCPVCGMKASMGKLGVSAVVFKDGNVTATDGPRDLFRYLLNPGKYDFDKEKIKAIYVTDYDSKRIVNAKQAYYVIGSDVTGAMGKAPIPFLDKTVAEKFSKEHGGQKVVSFSELDIDDVTPQRKRLRMKHDHGGSGSKTKHDMGSGSHSK
jgi:nitrous oxide reductase accessory protein NosL